MSKGIRRIPFASLAKGKFSAYGFFQGGERRALSSSIFALDASKVMLVESPAKAKKIQEFLGDRYKVLASYGHVRDLPPKAGSVQPEKDFEMRWETLQSAVKHIEALEKALEEGSVRELYMATDPDREGEAISWHVLQELGRRGTLQESLNVRRISFTEITKKAVQHAMEEPRDIDENLVHAYLARRALDYLLGFHLSPILWRKLPGATSAGRVQSVALRMICEREKEIEKFRESQYWTLHGTMVLPDGASIDADLLTVDSSRVPEPGFSSREDAEYILRRIKDSDFTVTSVSKRETTRQPRAPFSTSSLQQEANSVLGYGASKTMQLAQELYEGGMITYMRTDSVVVSNDAVQALRDVIASQYGQSVVPSSPREFHRKKSARSQEAHEAIRPTDPKITLQKLPQQGYSAQAIKLYELIRNRTLASQAEKARIATVQVIFSSATGDIELKVAGSKTVFPGYLRILREEHGDETKPKEAQYDSLIQLAEASPVALSSAVSQEHTTKPPPRYTEGSLVKAMEEYGIGRPSTYAPTMKLLHARGYITHHRKRLHAEPIGRILTSFLKQYAPEYVDYLFTSKIETDFDEICHGEQDWQQVMGQFWEHFAKTTASLSQLGGTDILDSINKDLEDFVFRHKSDAVTGEIEGGTECPKCKHPLSLKLSHKGGPFIGCSDYPECRYTRSLPTHDDDMPAAPLDMGSTFTSLNLAEKYGMRGPVRLLGTHPDTHAEIFVRQGPYGPYIQMGLENDPSMRRVPLPKDAKPKSCTLKYALSMLALPKSLGNHPQTQMPVEVRNGKFGPFIIHDRHMRSIPKEIDPLEMSLEEGIELLRLASENKKFSKKTTHKPATMSRQSRTPKTSSGNNIQVPRARSAYQFFLKGMYDFCLSTRPYTPVSQCHMSLAEYLARYQMKNGKEKMKIMGNTWKSLDEKERAVFENLASEDVIRFQVQQAGLLDPTIEAWESLDHPSRNSLRDKLLSASALENHPSAGTSISNVFHSYSR